jgi:TonB family protein
LVLASDEDGGALDALKFSLASDIVELVVLTGDEAFLQTLREAVGGTRRLWHVLADDKVSDLLVAGEVGIVVIDVKALHEAASVFIGQIKRQFPDLVIVVAGSRDDEMSLAGLISAGIVYRFIHKPMSPARAKLFVEAAIRKYEEQRRRAAESPRTNRRSGGERVWWIGAAVAALGVAALVTYLLQRNAAEDASPAPARSAAKSSTAESPLLARAAAALAANRLTEPAGDNALELYLAIQERNPSDTKARAGLLEVHERLLARAENALLEERLEEAAAAIETARKSGVESGRITFLTAQLAKSRDQIKAAQVQAQAQARARAEPKADEDKLTPILNLAGQRMSDGRLLDPERDSARYYIFEALRLQPDNAAAQESKRLLAARLLADALGAIDRRDFARAAALINGSPGVVSPADIESAQAHLASARKQVDVDAWNQLLKNANERMQQDRLIEPANDNAKYFLLTLRQLDPSNAGLAPALQDLGSRFVAKARRALALEQYDAARSWLEESSAIGFSSVEAVSVLRDLDAALTKQDFLTTLVPANTLTLEKSVQPTYPNKARLSKTEGWVDVEFTVTETGRVKDVVVRATSVAGVFEEAAVKAVSQWRYSPVSRDAKPVAVRTQIRIRFALES